MALGGGGTESYLCQEKSSQCTQPGCGPAPSVTHTIYINKRIDTQVESDMYINLIDAIFDWNHFLGTKESLLTYYNVRQ